MWPWLRACQLGIPYTIFSPDHNVLVLLPQPSCPAFTPHTAPLLRSPTAGLHSLELDSGPKSDPTFSALCWSNAAAEPAALLFHF